MKFIDQQRTCQGPDGSYDLKESHAFSYKALSKELFVGQVYLRVYNDQPDTQISEPEAFCVALLEFVSSLVQCESAETSNIQSEGECSSPSTDTSVLPVDTVDELIHRQEVLSKSLATGDGDGLEKEEFHFLKNLRYALIALRVSSLITFSGY